MLCQFDRLIEQRTIDDDRMKFTIFAAAIDPLTFEFADKIAIKRSAEPLRAEQIRIDRDDLCDETGIK